MRYPDDPGNAIEIEPGSNHYNSPAIWFNGTKNGPPVKPAAATTAYASTKHLYVRVTRKKAFSVPRVRVEAFVSVPSLYMRPANMTRLAKMPIDVPRDQFDDGFDVVEFPWPPQGLGPSSSATGHRCVVARAYPTTLVPLPMETEADFKVIEDQHEAQCNMVIQEFKMSGSREAFAGADAGMVGTSEGEPLGPGKDGLWEFRLDTMVPGVALDARPVPVLITAKAAKPQDAEQFVNAFPEERHPCRQFRGFAEPTRTFSFNFDLADEELPRDPRGGRLPYRPKVDASTFDEQRLRRQVNVEIAPERKARFGFKADLSDTEVGQAQLFMLEQTDGNGQLHGGLTLVCYRVE